MLRFRRFLESSALIVFHATNTPLTKFDPKMQQSGYYPGFYTTTDENHAKRFGSIVYQFDVSNLKFFDLSDPKLADELKRVAAKAGFATFSSSGRGEAEFLRSQGYDGIKRGIEYIIFDPEKTLTL